ncbi:MAG TPA: hypothetical protein VGD74_02150 [Vulgatibacter sp.]
MRVVEFTASVVFVVALSLGCGRSAPTTAHPVGNDALAGPDVVRDEVSLADDPRRPEGIVGTVGRIDRHGTPTCHATLVGRDRVIMSSACLGEEADLDGLSLHLPQGTPGSQEFRVAEAWSPDGAAELTIGRLDRPVPEEVATFVAPVFLGNLSKALAGGHLMDGVAWISTYRESRLHASVRGPFTPQAGSLSVPIDGDRLVVRPSAAGGALFMVDTQRRTLVLVGLVSSVGEDGRLHVSPTGNVGDSGDDRASSIRAALGADEDDDGIPDDFDNCPPSFCTDYGFEASACANADQLNVGHPGFGVLCECLAGKRTWLANGDAAAEEATMGLTWPDACGSSVVVVFGPERPASWSSVAPEEEEQDPSTPHRSFRFTAHARLGSGGADRPLGGIAGFRFCSCDKIGGPLSEEACARTKCDPRKVHSAEAGWTPIDVWPEGLAPGDEGLPSGIEVGREGPAASMRWDWHADATADRVPNATTFDGKGKYRSVVGFIAATVSADEREPGLPSIRFVDLPTMHPEPISMSSPLMPAGSDLPWLWPDDVRFKGAPITPWLPHPIPMSAGDGSLIGLAGAGTALDAAQIVSPELRDSLAGGVERWRFVGATETVAALEPRGIWSRMALVPRPGNDAGRFRMIESAEQPRLADAPAGKPSPEGTPLVAPDDVRLVYTAKESAVYLIGGEGPSRLRVARNAQIDVLATALPPSERVVAATYDAEAKRLFFLDVDDDRARIVSLDVEGGLAEVLWTGGWSERFDRLHLSVTEHGDLLLLASSTEGLRHWLLRPVGGQLAVIGGRLDAAVTLAAEPVMGRHELVVPVRADGALGFRFLSSWTAIDPLDRTVWL